MEPSEKEIKEFKRKMGLKTTRMKTKNTGTQELVNELTQELLNTGKEVFGTKRVGPNRKPFFGKKLKSLSNKIKRLRKKVVDITKRGEDSKRLREKIKSARVELKRELRKEERLYDKKLLQDESARKERMGENKNKEIQPQENCHIK